MNQLFYNTDIILSYFSYSKPRGDSYMEQTGMLVGNFEFNP